MFIHCIYTVLTLILSTVLMYSSVQELTMFMLVCCLYLQDILMKICEIPECMKEHVSTDVLLSAVSLTDHLWKQVGCSFPDAPSAMLTGAL